MLKQPAWRFILGITFRVHDPIFLPLFPVRKVNAHFSTLLS